MITPTFAVTSAPAEHAPWATTQNQYEFGSWNHWVNRPSSDGASPILIATDVSIASVEALPPETNYAQSIRLDFYDPDMVVEDEERSLVVGEILDYPRLQPGWDGSPEDLPPSSIAADQAATFVELLPPFVPVPEPSVAADGEIILFWKDERIYVDVGFRGTDVYSYFAQTPERKIKGTSRVDEMFASSDDLATFLIETFCDGVLHV